MQPGRHRASPTAQSFTADCRFPIGQFVAVAGDSPGHNRAEMTGYGTFSTHDPAGQTLYGADIAADPDWQGKGIFRQLYKARRTLVERRNLKQMVAGGRLTGYAADRGQLTAQEFVDKVCASKLRDPALNAHLHAGYEVDGVHFGYLDDQESLGYATHLVLPNAGFQPRKRLIAAPYAAPRATCVCAPASTTSAGSARSRTSPTRSNTSPIVPR
jgi:GNAT superfamily N-acetyltransferase